jgi:hypothetical protein
VARKKLKWDVAGDMFGTNVRLAVPNGDPVVVGHRLSGDPIKRMDGKLKEGYLFRSPKANPDDLATIWATLEHFTGPYKVWVECESKDDQTAELTAFARISDRGEATMFAFSHSSFEKWSDEKEKADAKERRRKPTKVRVTKDGRLTARVTVETLGD